MVKNLRFAGLLLLSMAIAITLSAIFIKVKPIPMFIKVDSLGKEIITAFSEGNSGNFVIVNKENFTLSLYQNFTKIRQYDIAIGKGHGNKRVKGDDRTPEGIYRIESVEDASHWFYHYPGDSLPPVMGAYGKWFVRLDVPGFKGIGIHGFLNDDSLGKRKSKGCIRINNDNLDELVQWLSPGMLVIIEPSARDKMFDHELEAQKRSGVKSQRGS